VRDPITGRDVSRQCWNGYHARTVHFELYGALWSEKFGCDDSDCGCLCHPRNQVEPAPVIPGMDDVCGMCLGTGEIIARNSLTYGPCPACFVRLANSQQEDV
jgi:hypothetical protein